LGTKGQIENVGTVFYYHIHIPIVQLCSFA